MIEAGLADGCKAALLVHGAGGGGWEWNLWRGAFEAEGIAVHAPDLLPVEAGIATTRFTDYRSQVAEALHALPRPRAVVGASLGGLLALSVSGDADAVVLVSPIPPAPWHARLPSREWPDVVFWRRDARLAGTRLAMPDADDASALFAFRHWRDESGAVLREAHAGINMQRPDARLLCIASEQDADVPFEALSAFAEDWRMPLWRLEAASHVGPLLGRDAAHLASRTARWLSRS